MLYEVITILNCIIALHRLNSKKLLNEVVSESSLARITSYNVCYTKLLRLPLYLVLIKLVEKFQKRVCGRRRT